MDSEKDKQLRNQLINLLTKRQAHAMLDDAVADFPEDKYNAKAPNVEYTFWQLLEHIRRTQNDILDFMINPQYKEMDWPDDYWPTESNASKKDWEKTIAEIKKDTDKIIDIIKNPNTEFHKKILWGDGQTILREILLVADHTSYHIGAFVLMRKTLGFWKK